mmetsp:Transcript_4308/g.5939  ORF Transcript_4308/g.5939 Transcript_4308/m.5939 type:complete len:432 (-) Transcript_4308:23-1318(-)
MSQRKAPEAFDLPKNSYVSAEVKKIALEKLAEGKFLKYIYVQDNVVNAQYVIVQAKNLADFDELKKMKSALLLNEILCVDLKSGLGTMTVKGVELDIICSQTFMDNLKEKSGEEKNNTSSKKNKRKNENPTRLSISTTRPPKKTKPIETNVVGEKTTDDTNTKKPSPSSSCSLPPSSPSTTTTLNQEDDAPLSQLPPSKNDDKISGVDEEEALPTNPQQEGSFLQESSLGDLDSPSEFKPVHRVKQVSKKAVVNEGSCEKRKKSYPLFSSVWGFCGGPLEGDWYKGIITTKETIHDCNLYLVKFDDGDEAHLPRSHVILCDSVSEKPNYYPKANPLYLRKKYYAKNWKLLYSEHPLQAAKGDGVKTQSNCVLFAKGLCRQWEMKKVLGQGKKTCSRGVQRTTKYCKVCDVFVCDQCYEPFHKMNGNLASDV